MIVYICAPFAGNIKKNIARAIEIAKLAEREGHTVILPHTLYSYHDESERQLILRQCCSLIKVIDEIWVWTDTVKKERGICETCNNRKTWCEITKKQWITSPGSCDIWVDENATGGMLLELTEANSYGKDIRWITEEIL